MTLHEDNQGTLAIANDRRFSERTKHVNVRYFFIQDEIANGNFKVIYCPTADMLADIFTKALARVPFEKLRDLLGLKENKPQ